MGVQGHTTPVWYDEDQPLPDGYVSAWNATNRRFEPRAAEAAVPPGTYVGGVIVAGAGIDDTGATDSTAAINAKIADASVVGIAAGRMVRVRFPDGTYLTDGIVAKPYTWLDFGGAVFKKRVDGTTVATNSMLRAAPVALVGGTATVTNKALTTNVATLTTDAPHPWIVGSTVVVAGVDATFNGTYTVQAVPTTTSFTYAKTASNVASTASAGTVTSTTYYGTYRNMKVTGGTFDPNGHTCPAHVVNLIYCEDLVMEDTKVVHDPANLTWAFCVGGRRLTLNNLRVEDGLEVFQDGLHILHGQDITVNGGHFASGDDAVAIGGAIASDPYAAADPDPVRRVVVSGYTADSKKGHALRVYVDAGVNGPLWEVTGVEVHGIVGKAGQERNGGIFIESHQSSAITGGLKMVRGVKADGVDLTVGGTAHDDVNAIGVMVQSAQDVSLDVHMEFVENTAAAVGFDFVKVRESLDVNVLARCETMPKRYGVDARTSSRVTVLPGTTLRYGANQLLNPINFVDAPDAKVLGAKITNVRNGVGGILVASGTTTSLTVSGTTVAHVAGASVGDAVQLVAGTLTGLTLTANDFTSAFRGADPAILRTLGAVVAANRGLSDVPLNSPWASVRAAKGKYDALTAQTMGLWEGGPASPGGSLGGYLVFYLDPADWPGGVTPKLRLRATVTTNATAPASDFTVGLYPVSASAGGAAAVSATLGTVVTGSTAAVTAPALGTRSQAVSSEFDCPAAGFYALAVVIGSNMAASSSVVVGAALQGRAT